LQVLRCSVMSSLAGSIDYWEICEERDRIGSPLW
jgi:hypothetical protein